MWITVLLFLFGLFLLYWGGDLLVDSAVSLAKRFRVSQVLIGATIVSIGTTIPEVTVSALASFRGEGGIAYGNALGSVICNTGLIAGVLFLLAPCLVPRREIRIGSAFFFGALVLFFVLAAFSGTIGLAGGLVLLAAFAGYIAMNVVSAKRNALPPEAEEPEEPSRQPVWMLFLMLALASGIIYFGSNLLINNGVIIASALGVPEWVIALTFIALGTSLPELVTAVTAIVKRHGGVSLGNIIGANILNLTVVLGLSSAIRPITIPPGRMGLDVLLAAGTMLCLTLPVLIKGRTFRRQGVLLVAVYALYVVFLFTGRLVTDSANVFAPFLVMP